MWMFRLEFIFFYQIESVFFACAKLFVLSEKSSNQRKFPLFEVQNYNEATQSFCVPPINIVLFTSAICFFFNIPPFPMGIL